MAASDELQPSVFFRAFDIAFFIPGTLLCCSLILFLRERFADDCDTPGNCGPAEQLIDNLLSPSSQASATTAILQLAFFLVGSYILGLICHAIAWPMIRGYHDKALEQSCRKIRLTIRAGKRASHSYRQIFRNPKAADR